RASALLGRLYPHRGPRVRSGISTIPGWCRPWGSRSRRSGSSTDASAEDVMRPMLLVAWLGLFLTFGVRADDSKSKADTKPQWQPLLIGEDAKKAADLEKQIGELANADRYPEAIRAGEELLTLRTKGQGTDHWETVNHQGDLVALKKVAALPREKRFG